MHRPDQIIPVVPWQERLDLLIETRNEVNLQPQARLDGDLLRGGAHGLAILAE